MAHDITDAAAAALFTFGSASRLEVGDLTLLGTQLSSTATSLAGVDVTWGTVASLAMLTLAWVLNKPSWDRFTQEQKGLVAATLVLAVGGTLIPQLTDALAGNVYLALAAVGVEAGGYWAVAQAN